MGVNYPFRRRMELARLLVAIIGVVFKCQVFFEVIVIFLIEFRSGISNSQIYADKVITVVMEEKEKTSR
jgi:hypothetical protein